MAVEIARKIVKFEVVKPDEKKEAAPSPPAATPAKEQLLERGSELDGSTYKVKPATTEHAIYITINDNVDVSGALKPFEIFINSKNMEHFPWVVALTRVISGVFRKGGDVTFLVEELKSVFDPKGGYWQKGVFYPSVVAHIGEAIERHLKKIGLIGLNLDDEQAQALLEKRREYESRLSEGGDSPTTTAKFPAGAQLCGKCSQMAVIKLDNCMTCLQCGDSKCG